MPLTSADKVALALCFGDCIILKRLAEIFHATHQFFLNTDALYIAVFNLRAAETARLDYWLQQIRSLSNYSSDTPIIMVGTHLDECDPDEAEQTVARFRVMFPRHRFIGLRGVCAVSCRTGEGMTELQELIASAASATVSRQVSVPRSWVLLRDLVQGSKEQYVTFRWLERKASMCGILSETEVVEAAKFLVRIGLIIWVDSAASNLRNVVVINPQWLANVMAKLITFRHSWVQEGLLACSKMQHAFGDDFPEAETMTELLARFGLLKKIRLPRHTEDHFLVRRCGICR